MCLQVVTYYLLQTGSTAAMKTERGAAVGQERGIESAGEDVADLRPEKERDEIVQGVSWR